MNDIIVITALAKAQQLLLDLQEREYILSQVNAAKEDPLMVLYVAEELRLKRKKELKKDNASKLKAMVDEVSSWRDFMKTGKKGKKGEIRPPKLKTEDPNKSYVQRPVKRG
ncbi:hypothetical protein BHE74_00038103 [Ensete ventricosum]|uniref:Uncharacterized protein n=1 Tax=Ensete ventricosum TaxID=4639 RepID=A0A427A2K5_ENSVE|nr:hypothetical protein B296_00011504 [Ensete ventricosum]RWW20227.1 hypothetical protein GW17_00015680 [Ensete ventricosum]RWW55270.1 hypothetical protein BHE74_00038103 [Ensete ventricosum]RZS14025.1 hypothetical protein BHM03_00045691 [Ensete ventricosum]